MAFSNKKFTFADLIDIVKTLRGPNGCPWDKEQTHLTLIPFLIEESYELVEALENQQGSDIKEELGDVLFQVLLHSQIAEEQNQFNLQDVIHTLSEKLWRRHPHVFSNQQVSGIQEIWQNWETLKKQENSTKKELFNFPSSLPALQYADKIGQKTAREGFDWHEVKDVIVKIKEELLEVEEAITQQQSSTEVELEIGDLLFATSQLARHLNLEAETCLRKANNKFKMRYTLMKNIALEKSQKPFQELTTQEKEHYWCEAKAQEQK